MLIQDDQTARVVSQQIKILSEEGDLYALDLCKSLYNYETTTGKVFLEFFGIYTN
jgi:hypothetical protein